LMSPQYLSILGIVVIYNLHFNELKTQQLKN
jgi:hypothetical protein